jgi:hypothetical protein
VSDKKVTVRVDIFQGGNLTSGLRDQSKAADELRDKMASIVRARYELTRWMPRANFLGNVGREMKVDTAAAALQRERAEAVRPLIGGADHLALLREQIDLERTLTTNAMHQSRAELASGLPHSRLAMQREQLDAERPGIASQDNVRLIREQLALQKAMVATAKEQRRVELQAKYGKVGGGLLHLREEMNASNREIKDLTTRMGLYFAGAQAGIVGLVAAGSPEAFQTFTGSIKLLTGEIGLGFIPVVIQMSGMLQNAADWVRDLDSGTKEAIGSFVGYGVVVGIATVATAKLYVELAAVTRLFVANPWLLAFAAVAYLSDGFGLLTNNSSLAAEQINRVAEATARLNAMTPEQRGQNRSQQAFANAMAEEMQAQNEADRAPGFLQSGRIANQPSVQTAHLREIRERLNATSPMVRGIPAPDWEHVQRLLTPPSFWGGRESIMEPRRREAIAIASGQAATGVGLPPGAPGAVSGAAAIAGGVATSATGNARTMTAISTGFAPQQMAIESIHDFIQNQAVRDPMEQRNFEMQRRGFQSVVRAVDRVREAIIDPGSVSESGVDVGVLQ